MARRKVFQTQTGRSGASKMRRQEKQEAVQVAGVWPEGAERMNTPTVEGVLPSLGRGRALNSSQQPT